jgi:predicted NodU family carbamoyl transferase
MAEMIAGMWGKQFDALAVQNQGRMDEHENLLTLLGRLGFTFGSVHNVNHHLSHAALAFYVSPFSDALILSYDGTGNDGYTVLFRGDPGGLAYLRTVDIRFGQSYNNLGFITGIHPDISGTSSGKTMGLAAYGTVREDWLPFARHYVSSYRKLPQHKNSTQLRSYGTGHRINATGLKDIPELQRFLVPEQQAIKTKIKNLFAGVPRNMELRLPGPDDNNTQDLIKTVQKAWTDEVLAIVSQHKDISSNICVVGGCALNGITNYALQEQGLFKDIFFVPNASDCGLSAGAALQVYYGHSGRCFEGAGRYFSPYLGQEAFDKDDLPVLRQQYHCRELQPEQVPSVLARLLWNDLIVGVIRGRYEIGPRALGNRSILCNPLNKNMREILNQKVKHREWFRPFAPVAAAEDAHRYFSTSREIPYMSVICYTLPEHRDRLPSVTHVDGSARLQTLRYEHNPFLYTTLREFEKLSGMPVLLNTSFNPGGEPIVNYYSVGLEMLKKTDLDMVLIENTLFVAPEKQALLSDIVI